jgi:hypothetical protein
MPLSKNHAQKCSGRILLNINRLSDMAQGLNCHCRGKRKIIVQRVTHSQKNRSENNW